MKILGIHAFIHDSGACLATDGKIIAISEERLDRKKRSDAFPALSIDCALSEAGLKDINDADLVVYDLFERKGDETLRGIRDAGFRGRVECVRHHDAHAASAYFASPFGDAAILVVDGAGSSGEEYPPGLPPHFLAGRLGWMQEVQSLYRGGGNCISLIRRTHATPRYSMGPGFLYGIACEHLGFDKLDGGKLMGLAAYGRPRKKFREELFSDLSGDILIRFERRKPLDEDMERLRREIFAGAPPRVRGAPVKTQHADLAHFIQRQTEKAMLALARHAREVTGSRNLCLAGGVALNGIANTKIIEHAGFENVFIQPASNDAGIPLGCALWGRHIALGGKKRFQMEHAFLGRSYGRKEVKSVLDKRRKSLTVTKPGSIAKTVAGAVAAGKIVGLFHGRSEYGPRALGARSILADPRRPDIVDILNATVKFREPFRPYAPAVLEERAGEFFHIASLSPFMLLVAKTRRGKEKLIPGVVHADGTARIQTVNKKTTPLLYSIIKEFNTLTGIPMVLNTSLNVAGEPMAETPEDAVGLLLRTGLDSLAAEGYYVERTR